LILLCGALLRLLLLEKFGFSSRPLNLFFDLDREMGLAAWFSGALLLLNALLWLACYHVAKRQKLQLSHSFRILGLVFLLLSFDEVASVHESLIGLLRSEGENSSGLLYYSWVVAGIAFVFAVFLASLKMLMRIPTHFQKRLLLAGVLYVCGVIGLEIQGASWAFWHGTGNYSYALIVMIEEVFEILGQLVLLMCLIEMSQAMIPSRANPVQFQRATNLPEFLRNFGKACLLGGVIQLVCLLAIFGPSWVLPQTHDGFIEAQNLRSVKRLGTFSTWVQFTEDPNIFHGVWRNDDHLMLLFREPGQYIEFSVFVEETALYRISTYVTKGTDYGIVSFSIDGEKVGPTIDLYSPRVVSFGPVDLAQKHLTKGTHTFRVTVEGANPASIEPFYQVGLDGFQLFELIPTSAERKAN
jgi:hypothetical protein